jgi:U2 small nuclear ribonucleoprotein A'
VTQHEHYREFVIWKVSSVRRVTSVQLLKLSFPQVAKGNLRTLDFVRIKDAERAKAKEMFIDPITKQPNALAIRLTTSTAPVPGATHNLTAKQLSVISGGKEGGKGRLMTPEEKKRVVVALTNAKTADEVRKLERMLAEGVIPEGESAASAINGGSTDAA